MSKSNTEEVIALLWFILATQLPEGRIQDLCNLLGGFSLGAAIYFTLK